MNHSDEFSRAVFASSAIHDVNAHCGKGSDDTKYSEQVQDAIKLVRHDDSLSDRLVADLV